MTLDPRIADVIVESLRSGEVPREGLEHFATGIDGHVAAFDEELSRIAEGRGRYRFVRGEYGAGKTFFLRYLGARARANGYAAAYVRIAYPHVPLHKPVELYRALCSGLGVHRKAEGGLNDVLDEWLVHITERVADPDLGPGMSPDHPDFANALEEEARRMLGPVVEATPAFAQALSSYIRASMDGEHEVARGLLQWLSGDPKVASAIRKRANLIGKLDASDVLGMVRALATVVTQAGYKGLVILIDEVERMVRLPRSDSRVAGLELLQDWMGALDVGQLPSTLMVVAGTAPFFQSPRGVPMLAPLQQRIGTLEDGPFPDMGATQLGLPAFDKERLVAVGRKVRDLYSHIHPKSVDRVSDAFIERLARDVAGAFGGKVEVTPRRYLRELIGVLSRTRQYTEYRPEEHYAFKLAEAGAPELSFPERAAMEGREASVEEEPELPDELDL
ncbi:MAG: BREX system ATP-binding protein BrxD [Myxococcota bacterium]